MFQSFIKKYSTSSKIINNSVRVRFAPSPTGKLHIGGLRTAFYNYLFAKKFNGKFILRIEDTDRDRYQKDSVENIIESLKWVGIPSDIGPGFSENSSEYFQSNRLDFYNHHVKTLIDNNFAYKCFCDEKRLNILRRNAQKQESKIAYDGKCRKLSQADIDKNIALGKPYVIRFKLENKPIEYNDLVYGTLKMNIGEVEGDFVIVKSDGFPTYHFANIVDDHLMEITHVFRGSEWQISTFKHIQMYEAFKWQPPLYAHLPLIINFDGTKLSKRQNAIDVLSYRQRGFLPEALLSYMTTFGGGFRSTDISLNADPKRLSELVGLFDINFLSKIPAKHDEQKLLNINKFFLTKRIEENTQALKEVVEQLRNLVSEKYGVEDEDVLNTDYLNSVLKVTKNRIKTLNELVENKAFAFFWTGFQKHSMENLKDFELDNEKVIQLCENFAKFLRNYSIEVNMDLNDFKKSLTDELKMYQKPLALSDKTNLWHLYRVILCGTKEGPPLVELFQTLGKENILFRLENVIKLLKGLKIK